ncbi:uncharacterized protein LOC129693672 [Leucoraja erinacea]|uniref:uncharacterized protein LOC129693672 n=1 Tax=Leucoraja erinaceus TaxID=7782 RepID=UPI0024581672|nr:uncharacterized protein LOC129693672 [Leucoraja erinacea]
MAMGIWKPSIILVIRGVLQSRHSTCIGLNRVNFGSVNVELVLEFGGNNSIPASLMDAVESAIQQSLTQVNMSTQTGSLNHLLIDINSIQFTEINKPQAETLLKKVSLDGSAAPDSTVATSTDVPTQPTSDSALRTTGVTTDKTVANINTSTGTTTGLVSTCVYKLCTTSISLTPAPCILCSVSLDGSVAPDSTVATSTDVPTQPTSGCGNKTTTTSRIVGGTNAENGEWPWQVSLQIGGHVCGASIISDRWLISAAHCFERRNDPTRWQVYMGSVELGTGTRRDIRRIIVHPEYALNTPKDYDVAVLELSSPLSLSSVIYPICLPSSEQVFPSGQQCYITGWGALAYEGTDYFSARVLRLPVDCLKVAKAEFEHMLKLRNIRRSSSCWASPLHMVRKKSPRDCHRVTENGILPSESKVQEIQNYPVPNSLNQLWRFLVMMNFYRSFLPSAQMLPDPLSYSSTLCITQVIPLSNVLLHLSDVTTLVFKLFFPGYLSNILQEAEVSVIDDQTCRNAYGSIITPRMLCAGVLTGGVDSCQGDSGGPLACSDSRGTWFLAGIVSFGDICARPDFPGVYTRVTAVRDWVEQQTGV